MTTGSGIIHQEMPKGDDGGAMYGFQLWANLSAANKPMKPRYRGVTSVDIPSVNDPAGATSKIIAGTARGVMGPVRDVVTSPEYFVDASAVARVPSGSRMGAIDHDPRRHYHSVAPDNPGFTLRGPTVQEGTHLQKAPRR
jgi:redox-sensitive bicupin YhaK (pirin superfamily)